MTPSDKEPEAPPLPVSVLDIDDAERRENGEAVQLQDVDRHAIRQAREDEWEHPVIAPYVYRPLTDEQWKRIRAKLLL